LASEIGGEISTKLTIDIPTITAVVAAVSVIVGVVFTVMEVRHMARTRRTDVVMRIYERFESREMIGAMARVGASKFENLDDYRKKYGPEILLDVEQIAVFFEGIGALLEQDLIDIRLCNSLFGPSLDSAWRFLKPVILSMRERINEPFLFSHFDYLVDELNIYRRNHIRKISAIPAQRQGTSIDHLSKRSAA
jgi:hypothetical protein